MFWTPEERWERMAQGLFWIGMLFVAFTAYGIYSGDDWRGVVMTVAPGAICFGLGYMANARAEHLMTGRQMPVVARVIAATVVVGGIAFAIHTIRISDQLEIVDREELDARREQERLRSFRLPPDLEVGEVETTLANGQKATIKSLVRKRLAPSAGSAVP